MSHQSLVSLEHQTLDNTVGAGFLGVVGASMLFGITSVQAYWYYHRYPRDTFLHKFSVGLLWALDTVHQALVIHGVYYYVVKNFGKPDQMARIIWSIKAQVSINVVIILMVHCLYTFRVWLLGGYHRGILGYVVAGVVTGGCAIGTVFAYELWSVDTFAELEEVSWAVTSSLATSTTIDFIIAAAMCFYLRKSKGKEMRLNSKISRVIQYTLGSGLITSACSLSAMFTYILLPNTFVFIGVEFLLTKLYVGSFLVMLNSRERTQEQQEERSIDSPYKLRLQTSNLRGTTLVSPSSAGLDSAKSRPSCSSTKPYPPLPRFP